MILKLNGTPSEKTQLFDIKLLIFGFFVTKTNVYVSVTVGVVESPLPPLFKSDMLIGYPFQWSQLVSRASGTTLQIS